VLSKVNAEKLEQVIQEWVKAQQGNTAETMSLDGKVLRGSRRTDPAEPALEVVTAAAQNLKVVVGQTGVKDGDQLKAALDLLHSLPVRGKLVTADAGLLRRALANQVIAQGGDYLGPLKENAPEVKQAMDVWVAAQVSPPQSGTPS
jgi:hypothetical protein